MEGELSDGLHCAICLLAYNTEERVPMLIPCKNGHTICAKCISTLLTNDNLFRCPFDKVEIYRPARCSRNYALLHFLEYNKKYKILGNLGEDSHLVCMNCEHELHSTFEKELSHKAHEVITKEQFENKSLQSLEEIEKNLSEIRTTESNFKNLKDEINLKRQSFCNLVNQKIDEYIQVLISIKEKAQHQIKECFDLLENEINEKTAIMNEKDLIISEWKRKTEKRFTKRSSEAKLEAKTQFKVINQHRVIQEHCLGDWLKSYEIKIKDIQQKLDNVKLETNSSDQELLDHVFIKFQGLNADFKKNSLLEAISIQNEDQLGEFKGKKEPFNHKDELPVDLFKQNDLINYSSEKGNWSGLLFSKQSTQKKVTRNYGFFKKEPDVQRMIQKEPENGNLDEEQPKLHLFGQDMNLFNPSMSLNIDGVQHNN